MKNTYFKKLMMPVVIAVLGISGAFMTISAAKRVALVDKMGYRFVSAADPCHATKLCSTNLGPICKSGSVQLWGKEDESDQVCVLEVYERQ